MKIVQIGLKEKFQIQLNDAGKDGYGEFKYIASNKVILDSKNCVSAYDEIYAQMDHCLINYKGEDFTPLANKIINNFPYLIFSKKFDWFENLSIMDKLFMINAIHGASIDNPLVSLDLDDDIYDISSLNTSSFPIPIFDLSSSRSKLIGPYVYTIGNAGKIIWGTSNEYLEVDVDLSYLYGVYWEMAKFIDEKNGYMEISTRNIQLPN